MARTPVGNSMAATALARSPPAIASTSAIDIGIEALIPALEMIGPLATQRMFFTHCTLG